MTKNKIIISALSVLIALFLVFLIFAFIKWDINPEHWQENERGCSVSLAVTLAAYVLFLVNNHLRNEG